MNLYLADAAEKDTNKEYLIINALALMLKTRILIVRNKLFGEEDQDKRKNRHV